MKNTNVFGFADMISEVLMKEHLLGLINELKDIADIIIFGGVVRDYIWGIDCQPRDVDIVLDAFEKIEITDIAAIVERQLPNCTIGFNRFGGIKIKKCLEIDLWLLKDTWAFRTGRLTPNIDNLLKSVYLNIDAYAFNLSKTHFICDCQMAEIPENIDIMMKQSFNEDLNLLRAMIYSQKYNMLLSPQIIDRLKERIHLEKNLWAIFSKLQEEHYKECIIDFSDRAWRDIYFDKYML